MKGCPDLTDIQLYLGSFVKGVLRFLRAGFGGLRNVP